MVLQVIIHYEPPFSKGLKARANNNDSDDRPLRAFARHMTGQSCVSSTRQGSHLSALASRAFRAHVIRGVKRRKL